MNRTGYNVSGSGVNTTATITNAAGLTRPTSETNLRQLAYGSGNTSSISASLAARPGSALGLLQGSSIVNANGLRSTVNSNLTDQQRTGGFLAAAAKSEDQALRETLAAILPPDLRHLVGMPAATSSTTTTTSDSAAILSAVRNQNKSTFSRVFFSRKLKRMSSIFVGWNPHSRTRRPARIASDTSSSSGGGTAALNRRPHPSEEPNRQGSRKRVEDPP